MAERRELQTISVLSVESDLVRFSVLSLADGREVATSFKHLELLTGVPPDDEPPEDEDDATVKAEWSDGEDDDDAAAAAVAAGKNARDSETTRTAAALEPGQVEQEPAKIWEAVERVMGDCVDKMNRAGVSITCIKSMAITNETGTLMSWNASTGDALHNAIHWTDVRMTKKGGGGGGTAAAVEWLVRRSAGVGAVAADRRRFGTLDAWLLWRLTSGYTYATDVTNASYTGLFDLDALEWDRDACAARGLTERSWPPVVPSRLRGTIMLVGRLVGISVNAIMARPSAAMYGQGCYRQGQAVVTVDTRHALALGAYDGRRGVPRARGGGRFPDGMLPVVGYCEPDPSDRTSTRVVYGVFATSDAPSVVSWLVNNMSLVPSTADCMNAYASARPSGKMPVLVPALNGLPSAPYCRPDARLTVCGVTEHTGREHLIAAAVDSVCYTVADLVDSVTSLCSRAAVNRVDTVFADGAYSVHGEMLQQLANFSGAQVIANRHDMAVHGAARMAATAINATYGDQHESTVYETRPSAEVRAEAIREWKKAVRKSYGWTETDGTGPNDEYVARNDGADPRSALQLSCEYATGLIGKIRDAFSDIASFWRRA